MQPYLESLPDYIDGAPPWTLTNRGHGITSWPLKHDPEIPPRDVQGITYWPHTKNIQATKQYYSCVKNPIPTSV